MYSNNTDISLSLAVFFATDTYDHNDDPNHISATALLKPLRQIILSSRCKPEDSIVDLSSLVPSRIGTAIHDGLESAWKNNYKDALKALGYPENIINKIIINPKPEELNESMIPIYLENRMSKTIEGINISGKYDFVIEGKLEDLKTTSVYTYINKTKDEDYILQGSIYRWLDPEVITSDEFSIQYIFTDWSFGQLKANSNYPPKKVMKESFKLLPLEETERFIKNKINLIQLHLDTPETELPLCSDKELWRRDPVWKYYKNPNSTARSTKNFTDELSAINRMADDKNVGKVVHFPGEVVACKYCNVFQICTQKDQLILDGSLKL